VVCIASNYNRKENWSLSPPPTSLLSTEHPFSPDVICRPTVLFPNASKGIYPVYEQQLMWAPQKVWDGAKGFHWRQRWWKRISATELSREVSITCRKLDLGLPKKAKAVVGTLWSVSPKIYHDLCSSTWLFASFLKTHSCSFLLAF